MGTLVTTTIDHLPPGDGVAGPVAVARVRLNRPHKLNALTIDLLHELIEAARAVGRDREVRGVVLSGEGESFCAGLDFATVMGSPRRIVGAFVPRPFRGTNVFQEACWAWRRVPVPVVAAVEGHCLGGGLQIALAADYRFTTPTSRWSVMEAKWGIIPDMSGIHALSQQVGIDVAKRLTMTAETISGERAVALGLASELAQDPVDAALGLVAQIAARSPDAVAATKRLFENTWHRGPRPTFARERAEQARLLFSKNAKAARGAGLRKETPVFHPRSW